MIPPSAGTSNLKAPSISVTVPIPVPLIKILTPGNLMPFSSVTSPRTSFFFAFVSVTVFGRATINTYPSVTSKP